MLKPVRDLRPVGRRAPVRSFEPLEPRALLAAISWDGGGGDALWSNPLNWSLDFVPRQVDDVTIALPGAQRTIIGDVATTRVNSLTLDETLVINSGVSLSAIGPFDLGAAADLRINGTLNWAAGTWNSGKTVRVNPGGTLNIGSTTFPGSGSVAVNGAVDNAGLLAWKGGSIVLGDDGSITNRAGKAMDVASPGAMTGTGTLINHGLLRRGGLAGTTTTINAAFESTDRLYVLRGTVAIGEDSSSPQAEIAGRVALLDASSQITFNAPASHDDGVEYTGPGGVLFDSAPQTFLGDALLGAGEVDFRAINGSSTIPFRFQGGGEIRGGFEADLAFFAILAPTTWNGTFDLADTIISDTGIVSRPLLTLRGSAVMSTVAMAVDCAVAQGASLQIGLTTFSTGSATISGGYALGNSGTVTHNTGTLVIGVNASLRNEVTGRLVLRGPTVGGGPLSGPVVNLGTLERRTSPTGNATTVITGGLDNQGTVDVVEGTLNVTGAIVQLPHVPAAQNTTLSGGTWRVRHGATLNVAQPIELVGSNAILDLQGLSGVPDLVGFLRENRGTILMSGSRPGITGPGPAIVNKGTLQMDGDLFSLQVFGTPIDQRAGGRIIVKNGTLQLHGVSGASRDFSNPGLIRVEAGTLSLDLDDGAVQGTFINTGTLDIRSDGKVTVDGAMSTSGTVITQLTTLFRGHAVTTRGLAIGGTLRANYVSGTYTNFFTSTVFVVGALSVTGSFGTYTPTNVPSGFTAVLSTMFGVSIRLEA